MAKFTRYDPKNKKKNNHKTLSQNKDLKIKEVTKYDKYIGKELKEVMYDADVDDKQILT